MARGYRLYFFKRSKKDGSGKATLVKTNDCQAYGVLYKIAQKERANLDNLEGKGNGYERCDAFGVAFLADGRELTASTYLATPSACDASLIPYDWYRALVLAGARQHKLPETYIAMLEEVRFNSDPIKERPNRKEALSVLMCAGFTELAEQCS